jgi:hypothetical protein
LSGRGIRSGKSALQSILIQGSSTADAIDIRAEALVDPRTDARVVARVRPVHRGFQVQLDTLTARIDRNRWALSHPMKISYGDKIQVDDFVLASGPRRVALNGVVDRRGGQAFHVQIDSLPLQQIAQALGLGELDGTANLSANLTGPAHSPNIQGEWDVGVRTRDHAVGTVRGLAEWRRDGLTLDARVSPIKSDSLRVKVRLPLALSLAISDPRRRAVSRIPGGELQVDIQGRAIDLKKLRPLLDQEKARDLEGKLTVDAHARGSLDAPRLFGTVALAKGRLQIPSLGATYHAELKLDLKGQEARLVQAHVEAGKGRVHVNGRIGVGVFPPTLDLTSQLRDFRAASADELRASLSGNLHLHGTVSAPLLSGALQLHNSDFYLQAKNLEHSAEAVELTPDDLMVLDKRFGSEVVRRSRKSRAPLHAWGLGLEVTLSHNNWLRQ